MRVYALDSKVDHPSCYIHASLGIIFTDASALGSCFSSGVRDMGELWQVVAGRLEIVLPETPIPLN